MEERAVVVAVMVEVGKVWRSGGPRAAVVMEVVVMAMVEEAAEASAAARAATVRAMGG